MISVFSFFLELLPFFQHFGIWKWNAINSLERLHICFAFPVCGRILKTRISHDTTFKSIKISFRRCCFWWALYILNSSYSVLTCLLSPSYLSFTITTTTTTTTTAARLYKAGSCYVTQPGLKFNSPPVFACQVLWL